MNDIIFESNADQILNAINSQIETALTAIGLQGETYAKQLTPVDTGRLRNSISNKVNLTTKSVDIGSGVDYAVPVELGTSKQKAQPYIRPAILDNADVYKQIAKRILSE